MLPTQEQLIELKEKITAIHGILGDAKYIDSIEIEVDGLQINETVYYNSNNWDLQSFFLSYEELTKDLEYFKDRRKNEELREAERRIKQAEQTKADTETKERAELERLQSKYATN